jgi:Holliday junction DNA helicase RuvA
MISSLRGTVITVSAGLVEIDVGGVGYAVQITPRHAQSVRIGAEATIYTRLVMRADSLSLYGFQDPDERAVFDLLGGVSGVGPKSAMGVLSALNPAQVSGAVLREDDAAFRAVPGIGTKTAKLIVVQLTGKVDRFQATQAPSAGGDEIGRSVIAALIGLGWQERSAREAVDAVRAAGDEAEDMPALLRSALRRMGRGAATVEQVLR